MENNILQYRPMALKLRLAACFTVLFFTHSIIIFGQTEPLVDSSDVKPQEKVYHPLNLIKVNLTGIILKNYALQYERLLNRKTSVSISFRVMPPSTIPLKSTILNIVGDDPDTKNTLNDLKLANIAITPEFRFYLSKKGWGQGFYIAPFYRYASFNANNITYHYTSSNVETKIFLSGSFTSNTGGVLFGVQKSLSKRLCLDIWIFGPHFGAGKGTFSGVSDPPLSETQQKDLRDELNSLDIPFTNKTVTVDANGASLKLSGPWGGVRSGLSLGIKF